MSLDNDLVRRAYLKVTVAKQSKDKLFGSLTRISSKKHWVVLKRQTHTAKSRLEIYKDEDQASLQGAPWKLISLDSISRIQTTAERKEFVIFSQDDALTFVCSARADLDDWMRDLDMLRRGRGVHVEKEKFSFEVPEDEQFHVRLRKSESLLFHGPCQLEIDRDYEKNLFHLAIYTDDDQSRLIVKWQIDHIRQYGSNEVAFKFQSGSKSPTGVDWFILDTDPGCAPRIHRAVDYWARHIVEEATNTAPPFGRNVGRPRGSSGKINSPPLPLPPSPAALLNGTSSSTSTGVYTPLNVGTREETTVYDNPRDNRDLPPTPPRPSSSIPSSSSLYQPLTMNPSPASEYAGLNEATRERKRTFGGVDSHRPPLPPPPASASSEPQYMGLTSSTRNQQESQYMGVNHSNS